MNSRRPFIAALAAALVTATTAPLALAQAPAKMVRIGLIHVGNDHVPPSHTPLLEGMRALGYEEGKNNEFPRPKGRGINCIRPNCLRPKGRGIEPGEIE